MSSRASVTLIVAVMIGAVTYLVHAHQVGSNIKDLSLRPSREILVRTHKLRPPFSVEVARTNASESDELDTKFALEGRIHTSKVVPSLHYQWIIPEGVSVLPEYGLSGVLTHVHPRESVTVKLEFETSSEANQRVHLRIWTPEQSEKMIQSAQYNTRDQEKIDQARREVSQRQDDYLLNHPELLKNYK